MRRDKVQRAIIAAGFGPLHEQQPGAPTGDPAPGAPAPEASGGAPAPAGEDRSGWIPRERFAEVNGELQRLRKAEEDRVAAEATKKGEFEKLHEVEKSKREAAEARATQIGQRAAFIAAASGKVQDPEAAYKLAKADGLLSDLDVDDDGNAKDAKRPGAIVDEIVKRYEFLKATKNDGSFGGDRSGAGGTGSPGFDPNKASARDLLRHGIEATSRR
jgi:hypothetical protein